MRAWRVIEGDEVFIPLVLHRLCAGFPSPADDHVEEVIDLTRLLVANRPATFLFRVSGDCLVDAGIFDGDLLLVDRSLTAQHRDIVVAIVEGEQTLKRVLIERGRPRLVNDNKRLRPFVLPDGAGFEVWGVATCALHSLRRGLR